MKAKHQIPQIRASDKLTPSVTRAGAAAGPYGFLDHKILRFDFQEGNGHAWVSKRNVIAGPLNWKKAVATFVGSTVHFGTQSLEDHNFAYGGAHVSAAVAGTALAVTVQALLRDRNGDDPWTARYDVMVLFFG